MTVAFTDRRSHAQADHADIASFVMASGVGIELMRTSYQTQVFPRHTHEYFTLGVMLSGVGTLWAHGAERTVHRGDIVLIPPGEVHTGGLGGGGEVLSYLAVHLPAEVFAECSDALDIRRGQPPNFPSVIIQDAAVGTELRRLDAIMGSTLAASTSIASTALSGPCIDEGAADDALSAAVCLLVERHVDSTAPTERAPLNREPGFVRIAREIIDDCYADKTQTSLRSLALRSGVTPFHLVRGFTQSVGLSPHRYVVQTRVHHATKLLARGIPSSFVAAMTGFVDQSHLTTQFKRYVGTTPAAYQRCLAGPTQRASVRTGTDSLGA